MLFLILKSATQNNMTTFTAYMPFAFNQRHFNSTSITPPADWLRELDRIEPGVTVPLDEAWCLIKLQPGPHGVFRGPHLTRQDRTVWFNQETGLLWDEEENAWLGAMWEGRLSESVVEAAGVKVHKRPRSKRCRARAP